MTGSRRIMIGAHRVSNKNTKHYPFKKTSDFKDDKLLYIIEASYSQNSETMQRPSKEQKSSVWRTPQPATKTSSDYAHHIQYGELRKTAWHIPQPNVKTSSNYADYSRINIFWESPKEKLCRNLQANLATQYKFLKVKPDNKNYQKNYQQAYKDIEDFIESAESDKTFKIVECKKFLTDYPKLEEKKQEKTPSENRSPA